LPFHAVITGSAGAGKSELVRFLQRRYSTDVENASPTEIPHTPSAELCAFFDGIARGKIVSFNYDQVAHTILADERGVQTQNERDRLAQRVFNEQTELEMLEQWLHPAVYQKVGEMLAKAEEAQFILHEIPLWWETRSLFTRQFGQDPDCVVVLTVDAQTQIARLQERGYSSERIARIRDKQLKPENWRKIQQEMPGLLHIF
jgi:dephospho-CoA kinase